MEVRLGFCACAKAGSKQGSWRLESFISEVSHIPGKTPALLAGRVASGEGVNATIRSDLLGGRLTVRLQTLDLRIGVRVPASQPLSPESGLNPALFFQDFELEPVCPR